MCGVCIRINLAYLTQQAVSLLSNYFGLASSDGKHCDCLQKLAYCTKVTFTLAALPPFVSGPTHLVNGRGCSSNPGGYNCL